MSWTVVSFPFVTRFRFFLTFWRKCVAFCFQSMDNSGNPEFLVRGIERLYEGDVAPADPFKDLVSIQTENVLGEQGASRIVPWLHKNTARHMDYLVVITDPRSKSTELRSTMKSLSKGVTKDILEKTIIINADGPPENKR